MQLKSFLSFLAIFLVFNRASRSETNNSWKYIGARPASINKPDYSIFSPQVFKFTVPQRGFYGILLQGPFKKGLFRKMALKVKTSKDLQLLLTVEESGGQEYLQFLQCKANKINFFSLHPGDFKLTKGKRDKNRRLDWVRARGIALASYDAFHKTSREIFLVRTQLVRKNFRRKDYYRPKRKMKSFDLYLLNYLEKGIRQLTRTQKDSEIYPHASPDGEKLTYTLLSRDVDGDGGLLMESRDEEAARIAIFDLKTNKSRILPTPEGSRYSSFLPDGKRLLLLAPHNKKRSCDIFLYNLADEELTNLTKSRRINERQPSIMGDTIFHIRSNRDNIGIYANKFDLKARRAIYSISSQYFLLGPRLSPNRELLAFSRRNRLDSKLAPGEWNLKVLDLKNHRLRHLTNAGAADLYPTWSYDSKNLFFARTILERGITSIYIIDVQNYHTRKLIEIENMQLTMPCPLNQNGDIIVSGWKKN
ncbi:TolB family protein [Candidatus Riflebacteria bacterium]